MIKQTMAACLLATSAAAGDAIEGFFYIIGSVPATLPAKAQTDFASAAFRNRVSALSKQWSAECGAPVFAWHTNLISDAESPWASDLWVGILAQEATVAELTAALPDSPCATQGYISRGTIVYPSAYQYCAFGDDGTDSWTETCE